MVIPKAEIDEKDAIQTDNFYNDSINSISYNLNISIDKTYLSQNEYKEIESVKNDIKNKFGNLKSEIPDINLFSTEDQKKLKTLLGIEDNANLDLKQFSPESRKNLFAQIENEVLEEHRNKLAEKNPKYAEIRDKKNKIVNIKRAEVSQKIFDNLREKLSKKDLEDKDKNTLKFINKKQKSNLDIIDQNKEYKDYSDSLKYKYELSTEILEKALFKEYPPKTTFKVYVHENIDDAKAKKIIQEARIVLMDMNIEDLQNPNLQDKLRSYVTEVAGDPEKMEAFEIKGDTSKFRQDLNTQLLTKGIKKENNEIKQMLSKEDHNILNNLKELKKQAFIQALLEREIAAANLNSNKDKIVNALKESLSELEIDQLEKLGGNLSTELENGRNSFFGHYTNTISTKSLQKIASSINNPAPPKENAKSSSKETLKRQNSVSKISTYATSFLSARRNQKARNR